MEDLSKNPPAPGMPEEYITEISRMGKPEVTRLLLSYLTNRDFWQRKVAIGALGKIGDRHTLYNGPDKRFLGKDVVECLIARLKELSLRGNED